MVEGNFIVSKAKADWKKRTVLHIPTNALKRLKKKRKAAVMLDYHWYELVPNGKITVTVGGKKYKVSEDVLKKVEDTVRKG